MLTEQQRELARIVLVEPRNPLNIGAAARAMANFGFRRLAVVNPYGPSWREARSAVGAPELLTQAEEFPSLMEAISGATLVLGTGTLTYRRPEQPAIALPELTSFALPRLGGTGSRLAVLFGSEKHGLSRDDLSWCHGLLVIPTDERQPSMNLGQAVAVCLYELSRPFTPLAAAPSPPCGLPPAAPSERLERLADLVSQTLELAEYSPAAMRAANRHDLRLMLRRLTVGEADLRRLLGAFRRILWRLERASRPGQPGPDEHQSHDS